jgi:hypothetical protein
MKALSKWIEVTGHFDHDTDGEFVFDCEMPEDGQEILATTTDNAWGDVVIIRTYYKEMHKSVIAWMPLPEPYREGLEDERSN